MSIRDTMHRIHSVHQKGFTLIELLLYMSIVGSLLIAISLFFALSLDARIKNQSISEVDHQGTAAMEYITSTIRNASSVTSPTVGANGASLTLVVPTAGLSPTVFDVSSSSLRVKEGSGAVIALTNSKVAASNLTFKNLTRSGTPGIVQVSFTLSRVNASGKNEYQWQKNFIASAALRWP